MTYCDRCGEEKAKHALVLVDDSGTGPAKKWIHEPRNFCDGCYHELLAVFDRPLKQEAE